MINRLCMIMNYYGCASFTIGYCLRNAAFRSTYIICRFSLRDAMLARYILWRCVCPPQAGIVPKRVHVGSPKRRRTMYCKNSSYLTTEIFLKFEWVYSQRGHQIQVGVKMGQFRPTSGFISETEQDRDAVIL